MMFKISILVSVLMINAWSTSVHSSEILPKEFLPEYSYINRTHFYQDGDDSTLYASDTNFCDSLYISPFFTDNMILQRSRESVVFGYGTPNGTVKLSIMDNNNTYYQSYTTQIASSDLNSMRLGACTWSIILPAMPATVKKDEFFTIIIECTDGCNNWNPLNESITITNIQFGDIWVCSGQSNMWLPVQHTYSWYNTTINQTTENYNIRVLNLPQTMSLEAGDSQLYYNTGISWQQATYHNLSNIEFSAVCYYFGRHMIDYWRENGGDGDELNESGNENVSANVPIGLIDSTWGGTIIEAWMSIDDQNPCDWRICENYDGDWTIGIYSPFNPCNRSKETSTYDQPASIYNGMILPLTNITIKGILWYQGEQNGPNPGSWMNNQGYACLLPRLINNWRREWLTNNIATSANYFKQAGNDSYFDNFAALTIINDTDLLPFGIISLHSWCGEEASNCYPSRNYSDLQRKYNPTFYNLAWLRWAQLGSLGRLPNYIMKNTFTAMGYDLADTEAPGPPAQFMGPIHPRNKWTLAKRISLAAIAIAYKDEHIPYIGPVVSFCDVDYEHKQLSVTFDDQLLRNEKIITKHNYGFEIQTNASIGGWFDVNISNIVSDNELMLDLNIPHVLGYDKSTIAGYTKIIGLRYAWRDVPCCNVTNWSEYHEAGELSYCPEANCAVYTEGSDLPLVPFIYPIDAIKGQCNIPRLE